MAAWLGSGATHARHTCELAASFALTNEWEFDAEEFRAAAESAVAGE
jgi:hypothetical protein